MSKKLAVSVPASSANLGVGYDVLGLALDLELRVAVELAGGDEPGQITLVIDGEGSDRVRVDDSNRFLRGLTAGAREAGVEQLPALHIEMRNGIPLARGLGSSAAATVAGLLMARELFGAPDSPERLLELATRIEGHPENAAASLYGGFVVVAGSRVARFEPPAGLRAVLFIPDRELATDAMRAVLPASVAHADAVHNLGRVGLVVSAFATGELSLLGAMYEDRLHEPYRSRAYPELPALVAAARDAGALGAALSGAGSSVMALCDEETAAGLVADALAAAARKAGLDGATRIVAPR